MKKFAFLACLLVTYLVKGEGFIAGTLVKTVDGYRPIEEIKVGASVTSLNFEGSCGKFSFFQSDIEGEVTNVYAREVDRLIKITVDNQTIVVAADQKFFLPLNLHKPWIEASELRPGHMVLKNCTDLAPVTSIEISEAKSTVYSISVKNYPNFSVSLLDIQVHNHDQEMSDYDVEYDSSDDSRSLFSFLAAMVLSFIVVRLMAEEERVCQW